MDGLNTDEHVREHFRWADKLRRREVDHLQARIRINVFLMVHAVNNTEVRILLEYEYVTSHEETLKATVVDGVPSLFDRHDGPRAWFWQV